MISAAAAVKLVPIRTFPLVDVWKFALFLSGSLIVLGSTLLVTVVDH